MGIDIDRPVLTPRVQEAITRNAYRLSVALAELVFHLERDDRDFLSATQSHALDKAKKLLATLDE